MRQTAFVLALSSSVGAFAYPFIRLASTSNLRKLIHRQEVTSISSTSSTMSAGTRASFIDIGANLLDEVYSGKYHGGSQKHEPDLDAVLDRASAAGVEKRKQTIKAACDEVVIRLPPQIIVTAGTLEESKSALELAKGHPNLYSTVGVHPTRCLEFFGGSEKGGGDDPEAHVAALTAVLEDGKALGKVVAVGECGLDYDRFHFCGKEEQARGFELQFELAERSGLPVFFHSRACREDFADLVRRNRDRISGGVVHSFTGTIEEMEELVSMGLYIGVNGCSLKTEENLEVVRSIPGEKLMLETDAPWCDIRPSHAGAGFVKTRFEARKREKFEAGMCVKGRVEPCHIVQVLEVVAATRREDPEAVVAQALANTRRLFFPAEA